MMKILTIAFLLFVPAALAGTYKWVDKDGNVHYSDKPVEGAEEVKLRAPDSFSAPKVPSRPAAADPVEPEDAAEAAGYERFVFISPKQDQVFWATGGEVPVQLGAQPRLKEDHEVNLYFNGALTADSPLSGLGTTLTEAFRGAHTVRAVIVDRAGNEVASAGPVTFHVKQRSLLNPQNKSRPRTP